MFQGRGPIVPCGLDAVRQALGEARHGRSKAHGKGSCLRGVHLKAAVVSSEPPDYGLDAPAVVRNLLVAGGLGFLIWGTAALGFWSGELAGSPRAGIQVRISLAGSALAGAIGCTFMAAWMIWDSKIGKVRRRERLLDQIAWTGEARVLDVGCGRGLMLIGAAKRLTTGKATGIDIWQAEDLSGNRPEATLDNAHREGVADRVEVQTADMRQLPFSEGTFDIVVSCSAIHNLYSADARAKAIREIARVLKPGGQALIDDIRHNRAYAATFVAHGCAVRRTGSLALAALLALITMGSLRPATLLVRKAA
jgi:arsenite methyltransferase